MASGPMGVHSIVSVEFRERSEETWGALTFKE